jgi:hypothetical protein
VSERIRIDRIHPNFVPRTQSEGRAPSPEKETLLKSLKNIGEYRHKVSRFVD